MTQRGTVRGARPDSPGTLRLDSSSGRWVVAATVLGSGIAALDATVVGIALPSIGRDFHADVAALQWTVIGYTLTLASLLLVGGALGDRYGRRRVFQVGVVWFALASVLCGLAPNATTLVVARAVQGVGGALLTPGSLAILQASFAPQDRARAIGAWSGLGGVATAVGPLVGGYLISAASWRLVFFVNVPVAALVAVLTARHVPESHDPAAGGRLDVAGAVTATVGLAGLTYGIIAGGGTGWTRPATVAALAVGAAGATAFLLRERSADAPMLPLGLFADRQFSATNAATFAVYGGLGGALFLLPVELQQVSGYSALQAGTALLPVTLLLLALSARSGALAARIGPRLQMGAGPVVVGAGLALLTRVGPHAGYLTEVLPAVTVLGLGLAATVAPLTATVMGAAPPERAGIASAVNNDVARSASLLAVAALPVAAGLTGSAYLHAARFDAGFDRATWVAAAACAVGGLVAAVFVRNPTRPPAARPATPVRAAAPGGPGGHCCPLDAPPLRAAAVDAAGDAA